VAGFPKKPSSSYQCRCKRRKSLCNND